MNKIKLNKIVLSLIYFTIAIVALAEDTFSVDKDYILKNGEKFVVKGVVYVPFYPGEVPYELARKKDLPDNFQKRILEDIDNIKAMGANTIRLWDAPAFCYSAIGATEGLSIIQTFWFPVDAADLQKVSFKEKCKRTIREVIDRIYSAFPEAADVPVMAYLVGNEISEATILDTNDNHPEINKFTGKFYIAPEGSSASECFLAEMADYAASYELEKYRQKHLVSYANHILSQDLIDTPFLDFRCFNAYSYAIDEYISKEYNIPGKSGFRAWVEYLKKKCPEKPLLVTETGLSVSPEAPHKGKPHYGYGGNTEDEQAEYLVQAWKDVLSAEPAIAGMCVHEYLDAWWKFSREDSLTQDPKDVEEWFGIVSTQDEGDTLTTKPRKTYEALKKEWSNKQEI